MNGWSFCRTSHSINYTTVPGMYIFLYCIYFYVFVIIILMHQKCCFIWFCKVLTHELSVWLTNSQTWPHFFWEALFCIMKISQRAFLPRSYFSNQFAQITTQAWNKEHMRVSTFFFLFQNLIIPSVIASSFLFHWSHTISTKLPLQVICPKITYGQIG